MTTRIVDKLEKLNTACEQEVDQLRFLLRSGRLSKGEIATVEKKLQVLEKRTKDAHTDVKRKAEGGSKDDKSSSPEIPRTPPA